MKRSWISLAALAALLAAGALGAHASDNAVRGKKAPPDRDDGGVARLARVLDLTEEQQLQIRALREAERERMDPIHQQLADAEEELRAATAAETFDEAAVRSLATAQAGLTVELTVSRARTRHQIDALLTPAQRELVRKLGPPPAPPPGPRPDGPPPPF